MERVRRKLTILLAVSTGVMLLGFLAVLIAVIYRVSAASDGPAPGAVVELPVTPADLQSATVSDGHITLTIGGADPRIEVRSLPDGALVTILRLNAPAAPSD